MRIGTSLSAIGYKVDVPRALHRIDAVDVDRCSIASHRTDEGSDFTPSGEGKRAMPMRADARFRIAP